jgi:hypothetical protein
LCLLVDKLLIVEIIVVLVELVDFDWDAWKWCCHLAVIEAI